MRQFSECTRNIQVKGQTSASEAVFAELVAGASVHYDRNKTVGTHGSLRRV